MSVAETGTSATADTTTTDTGAASQGGVSVSGTGTAAPAVSGSLETSAPGSSEPAPGLNPGAATPPVPEAEKPVTPAWPDDWRDKAAGGDEKLRATLERYTDPAAMAVALRNAQAKISQGVKPGAPPPNASPEELAEFRKQMGVPDSPTDYKVELSNGMVVGEADKPFVDQFLTDVHGKNWTPGQANEALDWYFQHQDRIVREQEAADNAFNAEAQQKLKEGWGGDFNRNINILQNFLAGAPEGVKDRLLTGRTADGKLIGDDPMMLGWLVNMARDVNPTASLLPAGQDNAPGVDARLTEIKALMANQGSEYWKGAKAEGLQKEYRELITAQAKLTRR